MTTVTAQLTNMPHCQYFSLLERLVASIGDEIGHLSTAQRIARLEAIRRAAAGAYVDANPSLEEAISELVLLACNAFINADLAPTRGTRARQPCCA